MHTAVLNIESIHLAFLPGLSVSSSLCFEFKFSLCFNRVTVLSRQKEDDAFIIQTK